LLFLAEVSFSGTFPGFSVVNVPLDGQCAFSAISHQLVARNYVSCHVSGDTVRSDVVDCLNGSEELKAVVSERLTNQTIGDYITAMRHASTWGDENMLYVASRLYDVEINVLRCDGGSPIRIGSSSASRSLYLGYVACIGDSNPTHYVSLLSNAGMILGGALVVILISNSVVLTVWSNIGRVHFLKQFTVTLYYAYTARIN